MDFEGMDHEDFREFMDSNEEEFLRVFGEVYSVVRSGIVEELDEFESGIEASVRPPNVCVFAPVDKVNDELEDGDYRISGVSEEMFLAAMTLFIGFKYDEIVEDDLYEVFFDFLSHQEDHWLRKLVEYITDKGFHEFSGRFFPDYNSLAVNSFISTNVFSEDFPGYVSPLRRFLLLAGGDSRSTVIHEMTHAYIFNESKFRSYTREVHSVDEAAAQAVSNVLDADNIPSSSYYEGGGHNQEVMQAARQVFLEEVEGRDEGNAISTIRTDAVEAIDMMVDGEDPVRALREEDDFRSRIVRIASYTAKRTADDVIRDLAVVGISLPYREEKGVGEKFERIQETSDVWGDLKEIDEVGKVLHAMAHNGKVREELVEGTEKLSREARKINSVINSGFEDDLPEDAEISVLEDVFGDPDWTDPAFPADDIELEEYLVGLLDSYGHLVEDAVERAVKLDSALENIHADGKRLAGSYENEEAAEQVEKLIQETERLHREIGDVKKNLEDADDMIRTALDKIEELEEK